jgi:hypothetical protein
MEISAVYWVMKGDRDRYEEEIGRKMGGGGDVERTRAMENVKR